MDSATLVRLRPADQSADAIRDALAVLREERDGAARRTATLSAERARLLLVGTTAAIAKTETAIRDAGTDQEQFDAIAAALAPMLAAAEAREADDARTQQIREAAEAIQAFNDWIATEYAPLAAAIAAGIGLERRAYRLRDMVRAAPTGELSGELPAISRVYVGWDARGLEFMVRLPATAPGTEPPAWPR
jgi:hypothetical protein